MRWFFILLVMLGSPALLRAQYLAKWSDREFTEITQLKSPRAVERLEGRRYRVVGRAFLRDGALRIRPLARPAEIELDYHCEWAHQHTLERIRKSETGRVVVDVEVTASVIQQVPRFAEGFRPPYWNAQGVELSALAPAQQALETLKYAQELRQVQVAREVRLWRLGEAKPFLTPIQLQRLGLVR